jgi:hypothetical protein
MDPLPSLAARTNPIAGSRDARRALAAVLVPSLFGGCGAVSPRPIPTTLPVRSSTSLPTQSPTELPSVSLRATSAARARPGGRFVVHRWSAAIHYVVFVWRLCIRTTLTRPDRHAGFRAWARASAPQN